MTYYSPLLVLDAQEAVEDVTERAHVMQVIEYDDVGQVARTVLTLLGNVG